ncbi:conserved hypothetical protein [Neospora caninum Liverpool]|uniref:Prolyl 4-hydroxylase alpha subunit Fe(2+) 2OG dioxygenase domain-containing protein n=1 Tax=Neospora caninum (strain Liverpool) TaxID=572307 RepID=F0VKZ9_NEOCL|nr:conserved hypothetical protein [Neospora caninum Liverpool]CBZ54751.1 conserved hypothetical protein [Neospora caninum Liverpool]|eukprot:XP_003884779.1 conserved hypothetical protein [Neospora caninum Liverpool]
MDDPDERRATEEKGEEAPARGIRTDHHNGKEAEQEPAQQTEFKGDEKATPEEGGSCQPRSPRSKAKRDAPRASAPTAVSSTLPETGKAQHKLGPSVVWDKDVEDALVAACLRVLNYSTRKDLERRTRSGTGTEEKGRIDCCADACSKGCDSSSGAQAPANSPSSSKTHACQEAHGDGCSDSSHSHKTHTVPAAPENSSTASASSPSMCGGFPAPPIYRFQKDAEDSLGAMLDEWTKPAKLREIAGSVAERAATVYDNVKARGEAEGFSLSGEEEKQLRQDVLKEALVREIHACICTEPVIVLQLRHYQFAFEAVSPFLFLFFFADYLPPTATPTSSLSVALRVPSVYVFPFPLPLQGYREGPLSYLTNETVRNLMKEGFAVQHGFLGEKMRQKIWKEAELLEYDGRFNEVGLWQLFKAMQALPFELNKKATLCLQEKDGGFLRLYPRRRKDVQLREGSAAGPPDAEPLTDISPVGDTLVLFRSRDMPHQVLPCHRKRFAITLWMTGPAGPGDDI